jgi:hypothetical protein
MRAAENNGTIKPAIPFMETSGPTSGSALIDSIWTDIVWSLTHYISSDFELYTDGRVNIYTTGLYKIEIEIPLKYSAAGTTAIIQTKLLINDIDVEDSNAICSIYSSGLVAQYQTLTSSRTVYLRAGDIIKIRIMSSETGVYIYQDSTNNLMYGIFRINFIPMGGWQNGSCGNIINRGVRR